MDQAAVVACIVSAGILAALLAVRARFASFEVKPTDLAVAILPVFLYLLAAGKIKQFEVGGVRVETAVIEAAQARVAPQVATLAGVSAEPVSASAKGGLDHLARLRGQHVEALVFRLGHGGYAGFAIQEYLRELATQPDFRYLVIEDRDGRFFGLAQAKPLIAALGANAGDYVSRFAVALNQADTKWLARSLKITGAEQAVKEGADKSEVLKQMDRLDTEVLPVVDPDGRFKGVVDRSRLAASLIVDVADRLRQNSK